MNPKHAAQRDKALTPRAKAAGAAAVCACAALAVAVAALTAPPAPVPEPEAAAFDLTGAALDPLLPFREAQAAMEEAESSTEVARAEVGPPIQPTAPSIEEQLAAAPMYAATAADLDAIPGDALPLAFALNPSDASPVLSEASCAALEAALEPFASRGAIAGFVLMDLGSGRGIARDADARVYGASSIKGPYALYLCQTQLDTGAATRDTLCYEGVATSYLEGPYLTDSSTSYPLGALIEDSVLLSDNDSYRILRAGFDGPAFSTWLSDAGVDPALANDTWFPLYSAREATKLWLRTATYLDGASENAVWLGGLLAGTERSFIRDALDSENVTVFNKAGWIASAEALYNGVCDAGIVTREGRDWLLCVVTSASMDDTAEVQVEALVKALFEARGDLI